MVRLRARHEDTTGAAPSDGDGMAATATGLTKIYGEGNTKVVALDDVDIGFAAGVLTAIMGPSGSGKSTLLHCLAGLDTLSEGTIYIGDQSLSDLSDKELTLLRRRQVGFIFQAFNLIPTLNASENITLPIDIAGDTVEASWFQRVIGVLGLGDRLRHRPSELSGGQQQRVAVARALSSRPDIVFADEPSGNLDSKSGAQLLEFLRRAVDELGQTIIMVTHDPTAAAYADRVIFLADGRIVDEMFDPTGEAILDRIKSLEA